MPRLVALCLRPSGLFGFRIGLASPRHDLAYGAAGAAVCLGARVAVLPAMHCPPHCPPPPPPTRN